AGKASELASAMPASVMVNFMRVSQLMKQDSVDPNFPPFRLRIFYIKTNLLYFTIQKFSLWMKL
ncbi:MAG: hypothetical protein WBC71_05555, partial [Salaquimonas sp.]